MQLSLHHRLYYRSGFSLSPQLIGDASDGLNCTVICHCPFFCGVYLYLPWPSESTCALRTGSTCQPMNQSCQSRITLWHSHPSPLWLTNHFSDPSTSALSTLVYPGPPFTLTLLMLGALRSLFPHIHYSRRLSQGFLLPFVHHYLCIAEGRLAHTGETKYITADWLSATVVRSRRERRIRVLMQI